MKLIKDQTLGGKRALRRVSPMNSRRMQQLVRNRPPESRATRYVATREFAIALCRDVGDEGNEPPQQGLLATLWAGDLYRLVAFIHG